jgi:hypothetical protein
MQPSVWEILANRQEHRSIRHGIFKEPGQLFRSRGPR